MRTAFIAVFVIFLLPVVVSLIRRKPTPMGDISDMADKPMRSLSLKSRKLEVFIVVFLALALVAVIVLQGLSRP